MIALEIIFAKNCCFALNRQVLINVSPSGPKI